MAKEWILNPATSRFQFNYKKNVGATSEAIRKCSPKTLDEWKKYYYKNVRSEEEIEALGKRLFVKVTEVLIAEINEITEEDCINFLKNLVINRTYDGYLREKNTIYELIQKGIKEPIHPAPDEWDRGYNVDFFIKINKNFIGLQIKPMPKNVSMPEIYKAKALQLDTHKKFTKKYGGQVFYIYSKGDGRAKSIINLEVLDEINKEIERLKKIKN